jgi:hypothetical protein
MDPAFLEDVVEVVVVVENPDAVVTLGHSVAIN